MAMAMAFTGAKNSICSSLILTPSASLDQESHAEAQSSSSSINNGNASTVGNRRQSLREQLQLLNLESLSRKVLRSTVLPRKIDSSELSRGEKPGHTSIRPTNSPRSPYSTSVQEVLQRLLDTDDSNTEVELAMEGWKGFLNPKDVVTLLNAMERWQKAFAIFKWLQVHASGSLNIYTYNVMLKVLRQGRQWMLAEEIAEDMIRAGIPPDNFTFSTLISCASRCNNQDDALKWFDRMHEMGCAPDEVTYSSMIDVYGKMGRYEEAVMLYERLREAGWKSDRVTFGTMIKMYGKAGNPRQALLVFQEMKDSGIKPDSVIYNTLISVLGYSGRSKHAMKVFEEMESVGVKPTAVTMSAVIESCSRTGNAEGALQVFTRLKKEGMVCDVVVYNTVIKLCGEAGLIEEAEQLLKEMSDAGCHPNEWTFKNMISFYAKRGMVLEAQKYFFKLISAGYSPDIIAYTSLLQGYGVAKDYTKFVELFDEIVETKCKLDERLCGLLLHQLTSCETADDFKMVQRCLCIASPKLEKIVAQIMEDNFVIDIFKKDIQGVLVDVPEETHKPFCNCLLDLCWSKSPRKQAFEIFTVFCNVGVYPGLHSKSVSHWCLRLRSLSNSAAHCALLSWLASINVAVETGLGLPEKFIIETGASRTQSTNEPRLHVAIATVLGEMNSPFEESKERRDWMVARGADIKSWLELQPVELLGTNSGFSLRTSHPL